MTDQGSDRFVLRVNERVCEAARGDSLQALSERCDLDILFGCFSARCGACRVRVLSGDENLTPIEDLERDLLVQTESAKDVRLACQCHVLGPAVLTTELE